MYTEEILNRAQAAYESGRQPQIMKQANTFLSAMTRGKYALRISEDGKDIGIVDSEHRVKEAKDLVLRYRRSGLPCHSPRHGALLRRAARAAPHRFG